jgi:hypothetical protein
MFSDEDEYFAYYDPQSPDSMRKAIDNLERYMTVEGPFEGIISFSQGSALAASFLLAQANISSDGSSSVSSDASL